MLHQLQTDPDKSFCRIQSVARSGPWWTHPDQDEVHFHFGQPLAYAAPHAHAKGNEAVWVVAVESQPGPLGAQPAVGRKGLSRLKLCLVVQNRVMAQVEQSLDKIDIEKSRNTFRF